jgi:hypothetical protein
MLNASLEHCPLRFGRASRQIRMNSRFRRCQRARIHPVRTGKRLSEGDDGGRDAQDNGLSGLREGRLQRFQPHAPLRFGRVGGRIRCR